MKNYLQFKKSFVLGILSVFLSLATHAQVSVTATGGTTGPTSYTTVNGALAAITAGTHQGDITINITGNTTEPVFNAANQLVASGTGFASYQSIRIVPTGNVVVSSATTPTANRGILEFIGADSITIDGDDPLTPGTRNLTFQVNTTTLTFTSALRFSSASTAANSGCRSVTVRNCIIVGGRSTATATTIGFGITASGGSNAALSTITTQASDNDRMLIENNEFKRCYYGFHAYGSSVNPMDSLVIRNNKFGNDSSAQNIGLVSIYLGYTANTISSGSAIIEGNEMQGGDYSTLGYSASVSGVNLNIANAGAIVRRNFIHDVNQPSSGGWGAYGIFVSSGTNNSGITIVNNIIKDIAAFHYVNSYSTFTNYGILSTVASINLNIVHNTIVLNKPNAGIATNINFSACVAINNAAASISDFRNNILVNNQSDNTGQACLGVYLINAGGGVFTNSPNIDRNNYWVTGASGYVGRIGTVNYPTLNNWKSITLKDSNSFNVNPPFVSAANLRLQTGTKSAMESNGALTSILTDIDGNVRPGPLGSLNGGGTAPDIGAHESDMLPDNKTLDSIIVDQITGVASLGNTDKTILKIKVYVSGTISTLNLTNLRLNTAGTTSVTDIVNAKVYYTGTTDLFSNANQFGSTVTSPSGLFNISGTQALATGVNYLWLTYDISGTATINNVVDGRLDSVTSSVNSVSTTVTPTIGNPIGNIMISAPMSYVSSNASHPTLSRIQTGSANNQMLRIAVRMSSTGAPVNLTQLNLSVNGSSNPATNADSIIVWSTGTNPNFISPVFFGGVGAQTGAFNVSGIRTLLNDTNYFWVTYNVPGSANVGDSLDAEVASITVAGSPQTPSNNAPAGSRYIRGPYCPSAAQFAGDGEIWNVTIGGDSRSSTCTTTGGTGSTLSLYSNHTETQQPINLVAGLSTSFSIHTSTCGGPYDGVLGIWIDLNQDGDFTDPGEEIHMTPSFLYGTSVFRTGTFAIPCSALSGLTRMRVILNETTTSPISPCGTYGYGETEDYMVNIANSAPSFSSTTAIQQIGQVGLGATNVPVLRVPVRVFATNCIPGTITQMNFNTAGTTSAANILNAKLYKTGNSPVFSINNLVGTVNAPSGAFNFILTDTTLNDTNNYWLTYDVSTTAPNNNILDARFDSVQVFGNWRLPVVSTPTGSILITTPMTYVGSNAIHTTLSKIERGTSNNQMLRILVRTSLTGAPIQATQFNLSTNGSSNPLTNMDSAIIWYTGSNANFVSPVFFGGVGTQSGSFNISGVQNLQNDTNYFWLIYRVPVSATIGDSLDAEVTSITIGGSPQVPTTTAPIGAREIRAPYCPSNATTNVDSDIGRVTFTLSGDTIMNIGTGCGATQPWANGTYTNNTGIQGINLTAGVNINFNICYASSGILYTSGLAIYIDFNQNGLWDTGEMVWSAPSLSSASFTGSFNIPCNALNGLTRMRLVLIESQILTLSNSCGTFTYGETEDYTVNIVNAPAVYLSSNTIQQTGVTSAGSINIPILRIPVSANANACLPGVIAQLNFNTSGTTSAGDIVTAKLYRTGNSDVFATTNLVGTVNAPNGAFSFIINDTAINGNNNYWLAYDVSGTAVNNNVLDARFDSVLVFGSWRTPATSAPTGNVLVSTPMTFLSSNAIHTTLSKVERGSANNIMMRLRVITSSVGATIPVTQFNLSTNGSSNPLTNIDSIIVWYTGANSNFIAPVFFGGTGTHAGSFNITGSRNLLNDTNYFWVTYRIPVTANLGDSVDVEIASITVAGSPQVPSNLAPSGAREIRAPYCVSGATSNADTDLGQVVLTYGSNTILNNGIGCTPTTANTNANGTYSNFSTSILPIPMVSGSSIDLSLCNVSGGFGPYPAQAAIYIDFNQNGLWEVGEMVWNSTVSFTATSTGSFTIPLGVPTGETRMRIVLTETTNVLNLSNSCGGYNWGETEDYTVNILPAPSPTTYIWNRTATASFVVDTNWTPSRILRNLNDRLQFSNGGTVNISNVTSQSVSSINVLNNTTVNLDATSAQNLSAWDSLNLVAGRIIATNNVSLTVGDRNSIGDITGSGAVQGVLARWIDTIGGTYVFPIIAGNQSRRATLSTTSGSAPVSRGTITVRFVTGAPGNSGLPFADGFINVQRVAENGVWRIESGNGITYGVNSLYNLSLQAESFLGVQNLSGLTIVNRVNNTSNWDTAGTYVLATGTTASPIGNRNNVRVFGEFTLGSDSASNPLPVKLLSFIANALNKDVLLTWKTTSEVNNKGFVVERSIDGNSFEEVSFVSGKGFANQLTQYELMDEKALSSVYTLYYRLRQIDFDGSEVYSNTVKVTRQDLSISKATVVPNPFTHTANLELVSAESTSYELLITDIQGKQLATKQVFVTKGNNLIQLDELNEVRAGVYFINLKGIESVTLKVVKTGNN